MHHCVADGVSGTQLYNVLCGSGTQAPHAPPAERSGKPRPAIEWLTDSLAQGRKLARACADPGIIGRRISATFEGLWSYAVSLSPTAPTSLVGPIGRRRRYGIARASLPAVRKVARAFQVTVNDVALAAIAGAYRAILLRRGEQPTADAVRAAVPVSIRQNGTEHVMTNRISAMLPMLPVDVADPLERLGIVHARLADLKTGEQSATGATMTSLAQQNLFGPIAWALRLVVRLPQRSVVTVTTNVPGPRRPLKLLGREVIEILPYVPIAVRLRTAVSVLTYHDRVAFGITADYDTVPDVGQMATAIEREIAELVTAAGHRRLTAPPKAHRGGLAAV
ncbi:MAG: WS/DGAT domain-containing protein [Kibdelosporangium sp.]